ncbi:lipopolysaccharide-modifying protein [Artemisia annua]|uniref:Lipopolysaccharide-modifying protein n=1 Tax=Artemisia annua TaxID=35608 RepID=A0A2U1N697_ARTAN|nr:lipopolysaccharide-modifying protein [Artemisia annua]
MDNVYDYMFHLLTAYSKLMQYKPTVPENATKLCSETMACTLEWFIKQLMDRSTVNGPANPSYDPQTLNSLLGQKANLLKQVDKWEKYYFEKIICCLLDSMIGEDGGGDGATSAMVAKQRRQWWRCDVGDSGIAKTSMMEMQRQG